MQHPLSKGQALQDYLLPLALVCVVGIASLSLLGTNLSGMLSGSIQKKPPPPPVSASAGSGSVNLANVPGVQNLELTLANGSKATLQDYPTDLAALVETVGGDGGTDSYAKTLQQLADLYDKEHPEDPDTGAKIRQLANIGFAMAGDYQKLKQGNDPLGAIQAYGMASDAHGFLFGVGSEDEPADNNPNRFSKLFGEIYHSKKIQDPALFKLFEASGMNIMTIQHKLGMVFQDIQFSNHVPDYPNTVRFNDFAAAMSRTALDQTVTEKIRQTQQSSSNICTVGLGQNNANIECKPKS